MELEVEVLLTQVPVGWSNGCLDVGCSCWAADCACGCCTWAESPALVQMMRGKGKPVAMQSMLAEEARTTLVSAGSSDHLGATWGRGGCALAGRVKQL